MNEVEIITIDDDDDDDERKTHRQTSRPRKLHHPGVRLGEQEGWQILRPRQYAGTAEDDVVVVSPPPPPPPRRRRRGGTPPPPPSDWMMRQTRLRHGDRHGDISRQRRGTSPDVILVDHSPPPPPTRPPRPPSSSERLRRRRETNLTTERRDRANRRSYHSSGPTVARGSTIMVSRDKKIGEKGKILV